MVRRIARHFNGMSCYISTQNIGVYLHSNGEAIGVNTNNAIADPS